jgi:hypothetical protein
MGKNGWYFCNVCQREVGLRNVHERGVGHSQRDRIAKLLETPCVTFAEVGDRVGVSRQRMQQIAVKMGINPGRQRQRVCSIAKFFTGEERHVTDTPLFAELQGICDRKGIRFEIIPVVTTVGHFVPKWHTRHLLLNGRPCFVGSLRVMRRGLSKNRKYYCFTKTKSPVDFDIRKSVDKGDWWVFPHDELGNQTSFSGAPLAKYGSPDCRHDYVAKYKEAWHLLSQ